MVVAYLAPSTLTEERAVLPITRAAPVLVVVAVALGLRQVLVAGVGAHLVAQLTVTSRALAVQVAGLFS